MPDGITKQGISTQVRTVLHQHEGLPPSNLEQLGVAEQVGYFQIRQSCLPRAKEVSRTPDL